MNSIITRGYGSSNTMVIRGYGVVNVHIMVSIVCSFEREFEERIFTRENPGVFRRDNITRVFTKSRLCRRI